MILKEFQTASWKDPGPEGGLGTDVYAYEMSIGTLVCSDLVNPVIKQDCVEYALWQIWFLKLIEREGGYLQERL